VTEIRGQTEPTTVSGKAEVLVKTKESWDYEALQKLEEKLAAEKAALVDSEKLIKDQTTLYNEALRTKEKRMSDAISLDKRVGEKASERDRWLNEEKELELKRAAAHSRAVELESLRTDALAQAVLAKEEAKVSENLALQRSEGMKQAQSLIDAHKLALQKLEEHRTELRRKEVDVTVKGEALPQPKAVDINVAVKPLELAEARVQSQATSTGAGAQSHIQENIPAHQKTVLSAQEVQVSGKHMQQTVEHHVVSQKDRMVM
jgi:plasmid stability protein